MTGFRPFETARPATRRGAPPVPVVPAGRCRPLAAPVIVRNEPSSPVPPPTPLGLVPAPEIPPAYNTKRPPVAPILATVAFMTGIPVAYLKAPTRKAEVVKARHIAFFVAQRFTGRSTTEIGRAIGGRDHATIIRGIRRAEAAFAGTRRPNMHTVEAWVAFLWPLEWPDRR